MPLFLWKIKKKCIFFGKYFVFFGLSPSHLATQQYLRTPPVTSLPSVPFPRSYGRKMQPMTINFLPKSTFFAKKWVPVNPCIVSLDSLIFLRCQLHAEACFVLAGIDEKSLLQAVDTAVQMNLNGDYGIPVPDYVEENVSTKVVKLIQSYTGVVDKMVWRKY